MYDREVVSEILEQILDAAERVRRRAEPISDPDEFYETEEGLDRLDAIAMMLIAIGESLKKIDRIAGPEFLQTQPQFDWKGAKGIRDVISHQYFDIDATVILDICRERIPQLIVAIDALLRDLPAD